jgi:membrane-bound lytic murein transglycosylase D
MFKICRISFLCVSLLFAACSHKGLVTESGLQDYAGQTPPEQGYVPSAKYSQIELPDNPSVQKWIDYFSGRGRKHMQRYLERSSRYIPMMKGVFRERGMPDDLAYVAMIESGFSATALSHASAVGYWQFIRGTGKRYSLRIDPHVDERRDPILSTQAAASYLDSLYTMFGDWYLSLGGYNAGENRIQRAVNAKRSKDFWYLASFKSKRVLPVETRNYIPKFIAAVKIAKDPQKYGFTDIDFHAEFDYESVIIEKPISLDLLAKTLSVEYEELRRMNPRYKTDFVPIYADRTNAVRVPRGQRDQAVAALPAVGSEAPKVYAESFEWYKVRRGDTISTIARRHGTSIAALREINDLTGRRNFIRVGQKLKVPDSPRRPASRGNDRGTSQAATKRSPSSTTASAGSNNFHVVRRGETLSEIANRYGLSLGSLKRINGLGSKTLIRAGQRLRVAGSIKQGSGSVTVRKAQSRFS